MYTFKRITNRQWQGNGFGTCAADHELYVNGKATGITMTGSRHGRYTIRIADKIADRADGFVNAKTKAISIYLA